jgi:TRAP-type C4-dicarboxylate transport system permease small subunit
VSVETTHLAARVVEGHVAAIQRTSRALAMVATLIVFVMLSANVVDIVLRTTADHPLPGAFEYTEVALVAIVFLGLPYTMQVGGHVAIDSLTVRLRPTLRRFAEATALVVVLPFVLWLTIASAGVALDSFMAREVKFGVVQAPVWPARMVIPIGAALLAAEIAIAIGRIVRDVQPSEQAETRPSDLV